MEAAALKILDAILKAPRHLQLFVVAVALGVLAFVDVSYDAGWHGKLEPRPKPILLIVGAVVGVVGAGALWRKDRPGPSAAPVSGDDADQARDSAGPTEKKADLTHGLRIQLDRIEVVIRMGDIVNIGEASDRMAVVLPANTSFVDDCMTDPHSALGAFVLRHYPRRISELRDAILAQLPKSTDDTWPPGTTICLPREFEVGVKVLVTASTERETGKGIHAYPTTVLGCVREVFSQTAYDHVEVVRLPVLGSGHGGLDIHSAILFLLLGVQHYGRTYHHVKRIEIVVREQDVAKVSCTAHRLAYVAHLQEKQT